MADIFEVEAANFMAFVGARPPKYVYQPGAFLSMCLLIKKICRSDSVFLLVMGVLW